MKLHLKFIMILTTLTFGHLFFVPSQLLSEEDTMITEIEKMIEEMNSLIEASEFGNAIAIGEQAVEKAKLKIGENDPLFASVLHVLGICYYKKANYIKAESLFKKALLIREKTLYSNHPDIAQSISDLAYLYYVQSNYIEAEPLFKKVLSIREKTLDPNHPDVAQSINDLANLYYVQSYYSEAEPLYQRTLSICEKNHGPEHPDVATSLDNLALVYCRQGNYAEAESLHNRALSIREKTLGSEHPEVALSLNNLAGLHYVQGSFAEAESLCERALFIREKTLGSEHPEVAQILNNLGQLYSEQGKYTEAESLLKRALSIKEKILGSEHPEVAASLNNLAILYYTKGNYVDAEPLLKRSLIIQKKILGSEHPEVVACLNNLGNLYEYQSNYIEAERLYKQVIYISEKVLGPEHAYTAMGLNNLASLYQYQSKYAEAERLYARAISLKEKALGSEHIELAYSLNGLANLYYAQGKYAEAETLYIRTLSIWENSAGPEHPEVALSQNNLADIYYAQGKYIKALALYEQALTIREKVFGLKHPDVAISLGDMANIYGSLGKIEKILSYFNKFQQSRQQFIEDVFSYASENQKMKYIEKYPLINHSLISFAVMNNPNNLAGSSSEKTQKSANEIKNMALEMILKAKAVVIDSISAERETAHCSYNEDIQNKYKKHDEVCGDIANLALAGPKKLDQEIYRQRLDDLYQEKDRLETELSNGCAEFRDDLALRRFSLADMAATVPEGSVLWEFVRYEPYDFKKIGNDKTGPPRYLAFTLNPAGDITLTDLGDAEEIDRLIQKARERIDDDRADGRIHTVQVIDSEKLLRETTEKLYDLLFAPLASHLDGCTDILITPDGQLNLLPFEMLPCPDGRFVIEKYSISYLSSGRDLLKFKKTRESNDWALRMADPAFGYSGEALAKHRGKQLDRSSASSFDFAPSRGVSQCLEDHPFRLLPKTREEAEAIRAILEANALLEIRYYYGGDALVEVLKGIPTAPRVLHLATHGFFCEDEDPAEAKLFENPLLRCGLILTGGNHLGKESPEDPSKREDGILTALEASGLNLMGTELVVLSACETGVGDVRNGEGVYGLRRAFQHAGARTVIMSLWKVPDQETCELMKHFYRYWLEGCTKKEALRRSALKVLNNHRGKHAAHPYFWGGFVLLGDPN